MTCTHQIVEVYLWTVLGGFLRFDHETINEMDHDELFQRDRFAVSFGAVVFAL